MCDDNSSLRTAKRQRHLLLNATFVINITISDRPESACMSSLNPMTLKVLQKIYLFLTDFTS